MLPGKYNIEDLHEGSLWDKEVELGFSGVDATGAVTFTPLNLTDKVLRAQVRMTPEDMTPIASMSTEKTSAVDGLCKLILFPDDSRAIIDAWILGEKLKNPVWELDVTDAPGGVEDPTTSVAWLHGDVLLNDDRLEVSR